MLKFGSVEFPIINLLIEGGSTKAKYITSHRDSVVRRGCLEVGVYLRGLKSVCLSVKESPQVNVIGQVSSAKLGSVPEKVRENTLEGLLG